MDPLPAFAITLVLISVIGIWHRLPPFFTLVGGAIFYGILTRIPPDQLIQAITTGLGRVFGLFAIVILSGAIIAKVLEEQGQIAQIVADIRRFARRPATLSGASAYLLALPVACSITAFIILEPVIRNLEGRDREFRVLVFIAALGSLLSFGLLYPTPVTMPLFTTFPGGSPLLYDALAIPLSLLLLGAVLLVFRVTAPPGNTEGKQDEGPGAQETRFHLRAWAPLIAIFLAIPAAWAIGLSTGSLIQVIMLAGAATALILAPAGPRMSGMQRGAKHAGVVIFDICGAGALASVILASGFAEAALSGVGAFIPVLFVPFVMAALIQTAQGSRVVTAVVTGGILAGSQVAAAFEPLPLILMIVAGTFVVSYVTDPYFWIVQKATDEGVGRVIRNYTLPLAACGFVILAVAAALQLMM